MDFAILNGSELLFENKKMKLNLMTSNVITESRLNLYYVGWLGSQ